MPAGTDKEKVIESPDHVWEEHGGFFINTLKMNNQGEYTSDLNLRKAIAHAMNYEAMKAAQDVSVTIMPGPTPADFAGFTDGLDYATYDLDKAREYLAQTPWPDGGITLDYVYVVDLLHEEIPGLILLEALAELNIELEYDSDVMARYGCQLRFAGNRFPTSSISTPSRPLSIPMPISTINITPINGAASILAAFTKTNG